MSADNWTQCPKCKVRLVKEHERLKDSTSKSYGKIPADEYIKNVKELPRLPLITESLREGWDIGIYGTDFTVSYKGSCQDCGFEFVFNKKINAIMNQKNPKNSQPG